jgi:hypothetical protein
MFSSNDLESLPDLIIYDGLDSESDNESEISVSSNHTNDDMPSLAGDESDSNSDSDEMSSLAGDKSDSDSDTDDMPSLHSYDSDSDSDDGYMCMAKTDSDSDDARAYKAKMKFPIFNKNDLHQWSKNVHLYQLQGGHKTHVIMVQTDAREFTPSEQLTLRTLLRAGHDAEPDFDTAMRNFSTSESLAYCTKEKEKAIRYYHEQQQILWANITLSVQHDIGARLYIDEVYNDLSIAEKLQLRGTDLLRLLPIRFTKDTAIEKQARLKAFLGLQMKPGQTATRFCGIIEESFLRLVSLGEYVVTDIDKICVPRLLAALHESSDYNELATAVQLQLDGIGAGNGVAITMTWQTIKNVVHKRDIDKGLNKRERPSSKEYLKSPKSSPQKRRTPDSSAKKSKVECNFCHKVGHYESECRTKERQSGHAKAFDDRKPFVKKKTFGNKTWKNPGSDPRPPNEWKCVKCGRSHPRDKCPLNSGKKATAFMENEDIIPDEYYETSSYVNNEETMCMLCEVFTSENNVENDEILSFTRYEKLYDRNVSNSAQELDVDLNESILANETVCIEGSSNILNVTSLDISSSVRTHSDILLGAETFSDKNVSILADETDFSQSDPSIRVVTRLDTISTVRVNNEMYQTQNVHPNEGTELDTLSTSSQGNKILLLI